MYTCTVYFRAYVRDGISQTRVAHSQPTTRSYPIRLVLELLWSVLKEVTETVKNKKFHDIK